MKDLPGFYNARRKTLVLDGYVRGSREVRRQRTYRNVTRDQALALWREFRQDLDSGRAIEGPLTLQQFVERFYERIAANHRSSTRKTQQVLIQNHLLRYFGDSELHVITTIRVIDFMADMRQKKLSSAYINNAVRVLKMLLRQAVERDVLAEYPIKKKVPKEREKPLRLELTREERIRFFAVFDDEDGFRRHLDGKRQLGPVVESDSYAMPRRFGGGLRGDSDAAGAAFLRFHELRELFVVAVETGLRKEDLRNLRWDQVNLASGFIRVLMLKTALEAEIPISRACRAALQVAETRSGRGEYVFRDASDRRYSPTRIRRAFILAKTLAEIQHRFRIHDLRHTFGCRLASKSVGLQIIAKALGHTTTRMAERYARPSEEAMRTVIVALDSDPLGSASDGDDKCLSRR
jgi:integrase